MTTPWPAEGPTLLLCKLLVRDWLGVGGCIPSQFPNIAEAVRLFGSLLEHSLWTASIYSLTEWYFMPILM